MSQRLPSVRLYAIPSMVIMLFFSPCARGDSITFLGTAKNYAVLAFDNISPQTPQFQFNGPSQIGSAPLGPQDVVFADGNVGIGSGVKENWASPATIKGTVYMGSMAKGSSNSGVTATGGYVMGSGATISQAEADALNAYDNNSKLASTYTGPALNFNHDGAVKVTATAADHVNVFDISDINFTGGTDQLQITGTINDYFIFNVSGDVTVSNSARPTIELLGGVSPNHVLFDVGGNLTLTNSSTYYGTFIVPTGNTSVHDGTLMGELITGGNLTITSGFDVEGAPFVPLPMASLGLPVLLGMLMISRRHPRVTSLAN